MGEIVTDFLPSPAELARAERKLKMTISLTPSSLDLYKAAGIKYKVPYQRIIRTILDEYATQRL